MKFRAKLTIAMVLLLSLTYGSGGSLMSAQSFSASIDRERDAAVQTYRMVVDVLELLDEAPEPPAGSGVTLPYVSFRSPAAPPFCRDTTCPYRPTATLLAGHRCTSSWRRSR